MLDQWQLKLSNFSQRVLLRFSAVSAITYLLVGVLIYGGSLHNPFILDDVQQLVQNPYVHDLKKSVEFFRSSTMYNSTAGSEGLVGIYYKPVMMIAYSLMWQFSPNDPWLFHVVQLALQILNSTLVAVLFFALFGNALVAFTAGLIYLVHPLNSEAVLMIADLQEPLYVFFGLSALLIVALSPSDLIRRMRLTLVCLLIFFSLLSKESGLQFVGMVPLLALFRDVRNWKTILPGLALVGAAYLYLRLGVAELAQLKSDHMAIMNADLITRLQTVPKVMMHYLTLFFWPQQIALTQDWVVKTPTFADFTLPLLVVSSILIGLVIWNLKLKSPRLLFFSIWYVGGWLMHSQLVPLDGTVSDRWFYFTMIGALGILIEVILKGTKHISASSLSNPQSEDHLLDSRSSNWQIIMSSFHSLSLGSKVFLTVALNIAAPALGYRSHLRSFDFRDAISLYTADLRVDPNSFYMNNNLGLELSARQRYREAIPYFQKTMELSAPQSRAWFVARRNLAVALIEVGDWKNSEFHLRAVQHDPDPRSIYGMVMWYQRQGKIQELYEFLLRTALPRFPKDPLLLRTKTELEER